jgi:hypothetical protein
VKLLAMRKGMAIFSILEFEFSITASGARLINPNSADEETTNEH